MLIRFNVKNFLSFSEREDGKSEEFCMIAGKVRSKKEHVYEDEKIKILKFAAVYGANAAGKSNLVKALDFMRRIVVSGLPEGHTDNYSVVLQPLIDTFIHKTLIYPQYLDFFMSSLMHFFVVLYCVSRETMV